MPAPLPYTPKKNELLSAKEKIKEFFSFFLTIIRGVALIDFYPYMSINTKFLYILTFVINMMRSIASVYERIILNEGINVLVKGFSSNSKNYFNPFFFLKKNIRVRPANFFYIWAMCLISEQIFKSINRQLILHIQKNISETIIADICLPKIHSLTTEQFENLLKTHYGPNGLSNLIWAIQEDTKILIQKNIQEFVPFLIEYFLTPVIIANNKNIGSFGAISIIVYVFYDFLINIILSSIKDKYQKRIKSLAEKFRAKLTEDLYNNDTAKLYLRSNLHKTQEINQLKKYLNELEKGGRLPNLLKLIFVDFILFGITMGSLYKFNINSLSQKEVQQPIFMVRSFFRFYTLIHVLTDNIITAIKAVMDIKQIHKLIENVEDCQNPIPAPLKFSDVIIEFDNVSFEKDGEYYIKNISFCIKKGQTIALVGKCGSGKSTIIKLINGFIKPTSGNIYIYGQNILNFSPVQIASLMTIVNQGNSLFTRIPDPISCLPYNVLYGHATDDFLMELSENHDALNMHENSIYKRKYEEILSEISGDNINVRLTNPSSGQKQQISLARAWRETPIVIFDEATSCLDTITEAVTINKHNQYAKNSFLSAHSNSIQTIIIVAHRLGIIEQATEIFVIDDGKIIERGTHDQLKNNNGLYKKYLSPLDPPASFTSVDFNLQ